MTKYNKPITNGRQKTVALILEYHHFSGGLMSLYDDVKEIGNYILSPGVFG